MQEKNKKTALLLSMCLVALTVAALIVILFFVPKIINFLYEITPKAAFPDISLTVTVCYTMFLPAFAALFILYALLYRIYKDIFFDRTNVRLIGLLSLCSFAEALVFAVLGFMQFYTCFLLSFAAIFLGILLIIVRNAFYAAFVIKTENDYTV